MINTIINNKYIVNSLIGKGGMAQVYKATRIETREVVAIKMLREEFLGNKDFVKMFNKEALISQQIIHRNVVNTLDVGSYNDCPYIVMEYVEGQTLKEYIKKKIVLTEQETLEIAVQVCDALIYAHEKGLVHRDIKPQNILLGKDNTAKIGDFGIAKVAKSSTITMSSSSVVGSVHYMSPEQAMGQHVGNTADIYSLGISMFEMLTGSVPFKGESPVAIALRHVNEGIIAPKGINTSISDSVNKIILKATNKSQEYRYSSAKAMRDDIIKAFDDKTGDYIVNTIDMDATRQHSVITKDMLSKKYQSTAHINDSNTNTTGTSPETNAYEESQERKKRHVLRYLFASIVSIFVLIAIFMIVQYNNPIAEPEATEQMVLIPNVVGQSQDEAVRLLKVLGIQYDIEYETDEDSATDIVLAQSPMPNLHVDSSIKVILTVSKGPDLYDVPDVTNMYFTEAIESIIDAGFTVGDISQEVSEDVENYVVRQLPKSDAQVKLGEEIDIWLSIKSDTGNIMPNVIGQSYQNAIYLLSSLESYADNLVTEFVLSGYDKGIVVNQEPIMDTTLSPEQTITLYISNGEGEKFVLDKQVLVSLHKEENHLVIVYDDDDVSSQIVYDQILTKGDHEIQLNLTSNTPGEKNLTIYCDGEEIGRDRVVFEVSE